MKILGILLYIMNFGIGNFWQIWQIFTNSSRFCEPRWGLFLALIRIWFHETIRQFFTPSISRKNQFSTAKKLYYTVNQLLFYLPQKVWTLYDKSCAVTKISPVAFTTFADLWLKLLSHIKVGKPMSDLCWVGQKMHVCMRACVYSYI